MAQSHEIHESTPILALENMHLHLLTVGCLWRRRSLFIPFWLPGSVLQASVGTENEAWAEEFVQYSPRVRQFPLLEAMMHVCSTESSTDEMHFCPEKYLYVS